ncbi:MAG: hypothetical protein ABDH29_04405 [Aquificaceae bacterium]
MYEEHIYKLYRVNLNLKEGERLLLLSDREKEYLLELMEEFLAVAQGMVKEVKWLLYPSLGSHGKEPPEEAWRLALE